MKIDAAPELERADQEDPAARHDHPSTDRRRGLNRPLDGDGIQCGAVARRAEIADIEFTPAGAAQAPAGGGEAAGGDSGHSRNESEGLAS